MTSAHILYIPTIFLLGFLTGSLFGKATNSQNHSSLDSASKTSVVSGKSLLGSFVIFALVFVGTHFFEIPRSSKAVTKALNGSEIFDKKPSYSSDEVYSRMSAFPEKGRELYQQFTFTIDILFPLTLFSFLFLLARFTINRFHVSDRAIQIVMVALPMIWFCSDMVENAIIFHLLSKYPVRNQALAGTLGYITIIKFTLLLLSILAPTGMIVFRNISKPKIAA